MVKSYCVKQKKKTDRVCKAFVLQKAKSEVLEWYVKPYNKVDEIAAYHDVCYDRGRNKGDCDKPW